jgi:hypothetical protein
MQNPFDAFDNQTGPVYGPPPAAPKPRDPLQVEIDEERLNQMRNPKPNIPVGYRMRDDGVAERIPGLPATDTTNANAVKLQQKRASLQSLETQINRVQQLYDSNLKDEALGVLSSLGEYLPTETNRQFDAASAGLAEQGLSAFRVPGVGAQSDTELRQFVEANRPMASDYDATIEEKLRQLRVRVDATRAAMDLPPAQWAGSAAQSQPEQQLVPPMPGDGSAPPSMGGSQPEGVDQSRNLNEMNSAPTEELARSTNGYQTVDDPRLTGLKGEYLRRLGEGQSAGELISWLGRAGVQLNGPLAKSVADQVNYRRANPNVPIGNYNVEQLDDISVPLSATESMMNDAAQTLGGAYAMNAGQALSLNSLDEMSANPERARIALADAQRENPVASTVGTISGSVLAAVGGEAALARAGAAPGIGRSLIADTAYGAGSGAGNAEEGQRVQGAISGGLAGLAGSAGGNLATRGAGSAISPTGGRLADLYEAGVRPTPGQRMIAAGGGKGLAGLAGRAVNATEEGLSSVPIVGSAIRGARQEARDQFQIGAYNQALQEIGKELPKGMKPGTTPYAFTKKAFDDAYDQARQGLVVAPDQQFATDIAQLRQGVDNLAEPSIKRFEQIVQNVVLRRSGPTIDGASFKKIQSEIGRISRGIRKSPSGDGELADALDQLQSAFDRAARRSSDPKAVAALDAADAGYAKFVRIRDAAKARGGEAGEFSPTQFDRSVQRMSPGQHSDAYLRGDALMQNYAQQGLSLVDRLPNSGTADRAMIGLGAAGAAGYVEPTTLSLLGIIGSLYAPGVRKVTTGALAPRGPAAKAVGDAVKKRARIAGAAGAGAALSAQKDDDR